MAEVSLLEVLEARGALAALGWRDSLLFLRSSLSTISLCSSERLPVETVGELEDSCSSSSVPAFLIDNPFRKIPNKKIKNIDSFIT
jgi:hypothetical protein